MAEYLENLDTAEIMGWFSDNGLILANIIILVINMVLTFRSSDKRIKADLVSKARIDWIQNVRKSASEFISVCFMLDKAHQWSAEKKNTLEIEYKEELSEINKHANLLILYFGPESNKTKKKEQVVHNETIINKIIEIKDSINNNNWREDLIKNLDELTELLRQYLKDEWDTAKKN